MAKKKIPANSVDEFVILVYDTAFISQYKPKDADKDYNKRKGLRRDRAFFAACSRGTIAGIYRHFDKLIKVYKNEKKKYETVRKKIRSNYEVVSRDQAYRDAVQKAKDFVKKGVYCDALHELLDEITGAYVAYIRQSKNQYNVSTPYFIRGIIGLTSLVMIDTVRLITILACGEPLKSFNSQTYIINYMQKQSMKTHSYSIFSSGKKMLTYKWGIKPTSIYNEGFYYAPEVPFKYAGRKDGVLGYAVREMLSQLDYDVYADVFGGSGRSILQFPLDENKTYHVNDLNPYNVALWNCLKDKKLYRQMIGKLTSRQQDFIILQHFISNYSKKVCKTKNSTIMSYNRYLHKKYDEMYSNYSSGNITNDVDMAVDFVLLHQFALQGRPVAEITLGTDLFRYLKRTMCSWVFERDFKGMKNVFQMNNVHIHNVRDLVMINSLPNDSSVVLQLDPPYVTTAQYGANVYSLQDIKLLMDSIKAQNSKRRFIFHCQTKYNAAVAKSKSQRKVFTDFMEYWKTFDEELFVTFKVILGITGITSASTDEDCLRAYLQSLFLTHYDDFGDPVKSPDSPEIIVTNFPVEISTKYNLQGIYNPYAIASYSSCKDNTSYRLVTVSMSKYLHWILYWLE